MNALQSLVDDFARGRLSRRQFLQAAAALGLSAAAAASVVADPERALAQAAGAGSESTQPGPATDKVIFSAFNVDQAPLNIQHGDMDLYLYSLKTAGVQALTSNPQGVKLLQAPATTIDILLNPAPDKNGLNPFSLLPVRQAMQYLVDRDFIANNIYQGHALPMLSQVSPLDYDELTVFSTVHSLGLRYDADYATSLIKQAMEQAGAQLQNNVWTFKGNPIVLKFIIRTEDERRNIGDLVRAAMGKAGLQVQPIYQEFGPATLAVYSSDPITFQWHLYTEGWARSASDRYDSTAVNQYTAPWLGNMPGWQETGYWQYQQPTLDKLGKELFQGKFTSEAQRDDIYRQMTKIGIQESVRIWCVTGLNNFPVRDDVQNLTLDITGGPQSPLSVPSASVSGKNELKVGNLWVWTNDTTWNPVGGFTDVYSTTISRNLTDATIMNHPFTGLPMPFRASYKIDTAGPGKSQPVPSDAVLWDSPSQSWKPVAGGTTAVTKVTFDYSKFYQAPWHHGQPITPGDLLYGLFQSFDMAYNNAKLQIETALGVTSRPYLETFKGFRMMPDNTFEVYVDYWHFASSYMASYASVVGLGTPWEILAAMDDVVFNKRLGTYSNTASARFNLPWLSLVQSQNCRLVLRSMADLQKSNQLPKGVFEVNGKSYVTQQEADARYKATTDWFNKNNLLVISNGPYILSRYDPPSQFAQLDAFRAKGYPFTVKTWRYGAPPHVTITPGPAPQAAIGQPITLKLTVDGPGKLAVQYLLIDPATAKVVTSGNAAGSGNQYTVSLDASITGKLFPSVYTLYVLASSDAVSEVAEQSIDLTINA